MQTGAVHREQLGQPLAQLSAGHNRVDEPLGQQVLGGLEAFWQLALANGLLDYIRPGKPHLRARLGQDQISQHGKAGSYPAIGGMGEHGDEQLSGVAVPL